MHDAAHADILDLDLDLGCCCCIHSHGTLAEPTSRTNLAYHNHHAVAYPVASALDSNLPDLQPPLALPPAAAPVAVGDHHAQR